MTEQMGKKKGLNKAIGNPRTFLRQWPRLREQSFRVPFSARVATDESEGDRRRGTYFA